MQPELRGGVPRLVPLGAGDRCLDSGADRVPVGIAEVEPDADPAVAEIGGAVIAILVEFDQTEAIFSNPSDERTENYVTGRFG